MISSEAGRTSTLNNSSTSFFKFDKSIWPVAGYINPTFGVTITSRPSSSIRDAKTCRFCVSPAICFAYKLAVCPPIEMVDVLIIDSA